jgi:hypothetical protein
MYQLDLKQVLARTLHVFRLNENAVHQYDPDIDEKGIMCQSKNAELISALTLIIVMLQRNVSLTPITLLFLIPFVQWPNQSSMPRAVRRRRMRPA